MRRQRSFHCTLKFWKYHLGKLCSRYAANTACLYVSYSRNIYTNSQSLNYMLHILPGFQAFPSFLALKPWPNGVASRRKLITWVYLRLRLARPCVHLRWLAMTCCHFGRDQICTQVDASSPFGHPTQVNASWVTSVNLLLGNKIEGSLP